MRGAYPLRIGLEKRPDEHEAQVIRAERRDRIQVAPDGVGVPIVPAEPPVVGRRVVNAEAMARQVDDGARPFARNRSRRRTPGLLPHCRKQEIHVDSFPARVLRQAWEYQAGGVKRAGTFGYRSPPAGDRLSADSNIGEMLCVFLCITLPQSQSSLDGCQQQARLPGDNSSKPTRR